MQHLCKLFKAIRYDEGQRRRMSRGVQSRR